VKRTFAAIIAAHLLSCAAMKRTWEFDAAAVSAGPLELVPTAVLVKQRTVRVDLTVQNQTDAPLKPYISGVTLTLPDGLVLLGRPTLAAQATRGWKALRGRSSAEPPLPARGSTELILIFYRPERDLRRHAVHRLDLGGVWVDGDQISVPTIELRAPPEAPIGEHI